MSVRGIATHAGPATDDTRATRKLRAITVGADILELLSSAMYVDPITIYREYVQNAADAVDEARNAGMLEPNQLGRVDILIDPRVRSVRIRDNGCGVPSEVFCQRLLAIGGSEKRGTLTRGFRGVGRLAGLAFAREVVFRTSAPGESVTSELRWNCRQLKTALLAPNDVGSAADLIRLVTSVAQEESADADEHFFEVQLNGVARLGKDQLASPSAVAAYLSQVAPVPFAPEFSFGTEITKALSNHIDTRTLLIHINGAEEPVFRPHRDRINCDKKRQVTFENVDVIELPGVDSNVAAVAWILHHEYDGALPLGTLVKGLRLRSGNIQVGDHSVLQDIFSETRFNGWTVGDVHVLDRRIVPNGRRDHFEQNTHYGNLLNHLLPTARAISRRCRTSSIQRKWEREFETHARAAEEKLAIIGQGGIGKDERNRVALDVEKVLLRMSKISEMKILNTLTHVRAARIASLREELSSLLNKKVLTASPLARLSDRERRNYERFFELVYQCSTNRVAAKSLIDRILMRIA
ncbi:MAG: ATP-binding protein [Chloroflexota bacterium]|nr:ATP-binding protein [Chloroflexota bacterium]